MGAFGKDQEVIYNKDQEVIQQGSESYTTRIMRSSAGFFWYPCHYPHWSRDALFPKCGILKPPRIFFLSPLSKKKKKPKIRQKKSENIMFMVILSALVKRLNVPRMQDFYFIHADLCHIPKIITFYPL